MLWKRKDIIKQQSTFFSSLYNDEMENNLGKYDKPLKIDNRFVLTIGDLLTHKNTINFFGNEDITLPYILGATVEGMPYLFDYDKFPHSLIRGEKKSGKAWLKAAMVSQLAAFNSPEELGFVILDQGMTPLMQKVSELPHTYLYSTSKKQFNNYLHAINIENKRRQAVFKSKKVSGIAEYKQDYPNEEKIPYIFVFVEDVNFLEQYYESISIDEKDTFREEIVESVLKHKNTGIKFVFTSERIHCEIIDRNIKGHLALRIALRMSAEESPWIVNEPLHSLELTSPGIAILKLENEHAIPIKLAALSHSDILNEDIIQSIGEKWIQTGFAKVEIESFVDLNK